ncbi:hypothetical protein AA313_de0204080 [Arthrobotrys entomopaga]|nr:hypothetical protein AA313_de0204080 [Arthrobotrys entomopaga]
MCYSIQTYRCGHFIRGYPHKSCKCTARCVGEQRQPQFCKQWFCNEKPYFSDGCSEKSHITNIRFGAYMHPEHGLASGYRPNQRMPRLHRPRPRPRPRATLPGSRILRDFGFGGNLEDEVRNLADRYGQLAFSASAADESDAITQHRTVVPQTLTRTPARSLDEMPFSSFNVGLHAGRRANPMPAPRLAQLERLINAFNRTPPVSVTLPDGITGGGSTNTSARRTDMTPFQLGFARGAAMARAARAARARQVVAGEGQQQVTGDGNVDFDDIMMDMEIMDR